jgi:hypothetical protein
MVTQTTRLPELPPRQTPQEVMAALATLEGHYTEEQSYCMHTVDALLEELERTYRRTVWKRPKTPQ